MDWLFWLWVGGGLGLMVLELLIPGLVVIFLGIAAVLVGLLQGIGLIESIHVALVTWMGLSVSSVLVFRRMFLRFFPPDQRKDLSVEAQEELQALGEEVEVLEACDAGSTNGRIRFQGTSWPARTTGGQIAAGGRARLLYRENLSWVVEVIDDKGGS